MAEGDRNQTAPKNIDYVITWVDGQDPQHKAARQKALAQDSAIKSAGNTDEKQFGFEKTTQIRFQDNGELYYNIASALLYAPFIRRIFVVSDGQIPPYLHSFAAEGKCAADFIQAVSHDTIFAPDSSLPALKAARPSFNSRAIEAALWRIPGLAEHFIFSNDDFFFNAPAAAEDFFVNGAPKILGTWKSSAKIRLRTLYHRALRRVFGRPISARHRRSLWLGAIIAGWKSKKYLSVPHCPHPLRKSVFADFFTANPRRLNKQLSFRFRSAEQFNPVSLANHLEMLQGAQPAAAPSIAYLDDIKSPQHYAAFLRRVETEAAAYGCIQDMGLYPAKIQEELHRILVKKFSAALPEAIKCHLLQPRI